MEMKWVAISRPCNPLIYLHIVNIPRIDQLFHHSEWCFLPYVVGIFHMKKRSKFLQNRSFGEIRALLLDAAIVLNSATFPGFSNTARICWHFLDLTVKFPKSLVSSWWFQTTNTQIGNLLKKKWWRFETVTKTKTIQSSAKNPFTKTHLHGIATPPNPRKKRKKSTPEIHLEGDFFCHSLLIKGAIANQTTGAIQHHQRPRDVFEWYMSLYHKKYGQSWVQSHHTCHTSLWQKSTSTPTQKKKNIFGSKTQE